MCTCAYVCKGFVCCCEFMEGFPVLVNKGVFEFSVAVMCKGKSLAVKAKEQGMGKLVRSSHLLLFFLPIYQGAIVL